MFYHGLTVLTQGFVIPLVSIVSILVLIFMLSVVMFYEFLFFDHFANDNGSKLHQ